MKNILSKKPKIEPVWDFVGFTCAKCEKRLINWDECVEHWESKGHDSFIRAYGKVEGDEPE